MENTNKIKTKNGDHHQKKKKNLFPPQSLIPPSDLMARIFSQLDCIDLLQCSLVCKQWYRDSTELREAWKNEYLEAYTRLGLNIKREAHPPSTTCSIRGKGTNEQGERNLSTAISKAANGLGIGAAMGWLDWLTSPEQKSSKSLLVYVASSFARVLGLL